MATFTSLSKAILLACACALAGMGAATLLSDAVTTPGTAVNPKSMTAGATSQGKGQQTQTHLDRIREAGTPSQQMAAVLRLSEIDNSADIRALLGDYMHFPAHSASEVAVPLLLKRWLELEPRESLEYCRIHHEKHLTQLIASYCVLHSDDAAGYILTLASANLQTSAWQQLCCVVADRDPARAWELIAQMPHANVGSSEDEIATVMKKLVVRDLQGALARMATMPPTMLKAARLAIAGELMRVDPERAWDWVQQQPLPTRLIETALGESFRHDPTQALTFLASLPPDQRRALNQSSSRWSGDSPTTFAAALLHAPGLLSSEKQAIANNAFSRSAWQDPVGVQALMPLLSDGELVSRIPSYIQGWYRKDKGAAEAWIASLPPGPLRTAADAAWEKAQTPPAAPTAALEEDLSAILRNGSSIRADDPRLRQLTAASLGEMMSDPKSLENSSFQRLLPNLATTNPSAFTGWIESAPMNQQTGRLAAEFSAHWAREDPIAAAAWVKSLPATGDLALNAASNVARQYFNYSPEEATTWVNSLPRGPMQDVARKVVAEPK